MVAAVHIHKAFEVVVGEAFRMVDIHIQGVEVDNLNILAAVDICSDPSLHLRAGLDNS